MADTRWIEDASRDDRVLIGADKRIRYRPLERYVLCRSTARCFTFPRGDLTANEMIDRLLRHLPAMARHATLPGPYRYHLGNPELTRVKLDCDDLV